MKLTDDMLYSSAKRAEQMWLDALPSREELPEHQFSKSFEHKMKKLIWAQHQSPALNRFISVSKRIAVIALVILTVSFSCLMCVEAYREKFIEIITEIFEDLTQYSFTSSWSANPKLEEIEFGYLPEGLSEIDREYNPETHGQSICFKDSEGRILEISQEFITNNTQSTIILDTEGATVEKFSFHSYDATLVAKEEYTHLMCVNDCSIVLLEGDFAAEELIKIANDINIFEK